MKCILYSVRVQARQQAPFHHSSLLVSSLEEAIVAFVTVFRIAENSLSQTGTTQCCPVYTNATLSLPSAICGYIACHV